MICSKCEEDASFIVPVCSKNGKKILYYELLCNRCFKKENSGKK